MCVRVRATARVCARLCACVRVPACAYACVRECTLVRTCTCARARVRVRRGEARRGGSLFHSVMLFAYNHGLLKDILQVGHDAFSITFWKGVLFCNTKYFVLFIIFSMRIS